MSVPFDKVVDKIVALGVPGLVLLAAMHFVGWAGAAAITAALAALGGPLGMLGGIAMLGLLTLVSKAIADYGFERIMKAVVDGLKKKGKTKAEIIKTINGYAFVSKDLKQKLIAYV